MFVEKKQGIFALGSPALLGSGRNGCVYIPPSRRNSYMCAWQVGWLCRRPDVHACADIRGGQQIASGIHPPRSYLRLGLSLAGSLPAPELPVACLPALGLQAHTSTPGSSLGLWGCNSGPSAPVAVLCCWSLLFSPSQN